MENSKVSGQKLKQLRDMIGASQREMATWLHCAPSSVPNYENGKSPIPFRIYQLFFEIGVPLQYFTNNCHVIDYRIVQKVYSAVRSPKNNKTEKS